MNHKLEKETRNRENREKLIEKGAKQANNKICESITREECGRFLNEKSDNNMACTTTSYFNVYSHCSN